MNPGNLGRGQDDQLPPEFRWQRLVPCSKDQVHLRYSLTTALWGQWEFSIVKVHMLWLILPVLMFPPFSSSSGTSPMRMRQISGIQTSYSWSFTKPRQNLKGISATRLQTEDASANPKAGHPGGDDFPEPNVDKTLNTNSPKASQKQQNKTKQPQKIGPPQERFSRNKRP